ncbi:unnamed protein product [Hydatigera taeniaeformis]|uniref:Cadherin domain-containing protein n=1 Tax=Hydatigena taeniaeformis TaxID=6205 RepID=A0A0R3WSX3_HYDTA|nr:unnamed protein product [Hydatigera taeniaeformis]
MWPVLPEFEMVWNVTACKLYLVLKKELDREVEPNYKFSIIARDGGDEPNTGSLGVIINVQDVNDNDPLFEESVYFAIIPESTKISSQIIQFRNSRRDVNLIANSFDKEVESTADIGNLA